MRQDEAGKPVTAEVNFLNRFTEFAPTFLGHCILIFVGMMFLFNIGVH